MTGTQLTLGTSLLANELHCVANSMWTVEHLTPWGLMGCYKCVHSSGFRLSTDGRGGALSTRGRCIDCRAATNAYFHYQIINSDDSFSRLIVLSIKFQKNGENCPSRFSRTQGDVLKNVCFVQPTVLFAKIFSL